ncbi:MAG TPA: winged helix-turn-helix domain-containing protein [Pseudoduganella sp.]|jgi:DNA-binding winged helix-turn-helix (wHTH) protein
MTEPAKPQFETLAFLDFELTLARRQLLRDGVPVGIGGRALDLLALLACHPGEVLDNRILINAVWPRTVVEEVNLRVQIAALRRLLSGEGHCPYIVNYTGHGYCFTAPVTRRPVLAMLRAGDSRAAETGLITLAGGRPAETGETARAAPRWRDPGAVM